MQTAMAQGDGGLGSDTTYVLRDKVPIVEEAEKLVYPAQEPEYKMEKSPVSYEAPSSVLKTSYEVMSVRPLAISREKPQKYPGSYVKLGFGTQFSPLAEIRHSGRILKKDVERMNYGVYFKHHSAYGSKIDHQDFGTNHASVYGTVSSEKIRLNTQLDYHRNSVNYYGYDHSDTTLSDLTKKDTRQYFNHLNLKLGIGKANLGKSNFDYDGHVGFYYFSDKFEQNEIGALGDVTLTQVFKEKHFVSMEFREDYTVFNDTLKSINRNIFSVKPKYEFNDQVWKMSGGVALVWENKTFHLMPDLYMERSLFREHVVMYSGWLMELRRLGYRELVERNPWIQSNDFNLRHTRFEDRFLGFKGMIGKFSYDLKFSQNVIRRAVLFVNDTSDLSKFDVLYTRGRMNILNPHLELSYRVNSDLEFMLTGDYFQYEVEVEEKAWHMPRWNINFYTRYAIGKKVFLELDIFVIDGVYAKLPDGQAEKLKTTADINIGATYKLSEYFSFFANLNNLASIKYQPYYRYPTFGFNGMVGVIFTYN